MAEQLKPCPFCGVAPSLTLYSGSPTILCPICPALMGGEESNATNEELIAAWNRRDDDAKDARIAEIARLRQHKTEYMEAAEETRRALQAEIDELRVQPVRQVGEPELISYAEDMSTCTLTKGDGIGYFYNRVTDAELDAEDARQVGGDEREAFEQAYERGDFHDEEKRSEVKYRYYRKHQAWVAFSLGRRSGAALAPAAVVEVSDDEIVEIMRPELNQADGGYICDNGAEELVNGVRLVIARLNRNPIPLELLETMRKNDARYQFLRKRIAASQLSVLGAECSSDTVEGVDSGIDAAIAKQEGDQSK